jgi:uncharacterized protein
MKSPDVKLSPKEGDAPPPSYWSPYVAGLGLGLTLLASFWILGAGLGASGGLARVSACVAHLFAPERVAASPYFGEWFQAGGPPVLRYYLVFMALGVLAGGFVSALGSKRIRLSAERGPRISAPGRLVLALIGGVLVGFASRLARGCTSGQALSGTALLLTGSVVFLISLFAGAYIAAVFLRRQWL